MYLEHFGLSEAPFRITPHTDFFFDGANRGATLDALIYAITHDEGIVKVSGEVGSGKTMLCRVLMERLPAHVTIIYLANPSLSREDILYAIADELRLDIPDNARISIVLRALQDNLIKAFAEGRRVVVLIDEAHAMPADSLEEIRLLSNLEANRHKLLQLVLFGQPELNDVLARPDMRQLKERITHNFGLEPLVRNDIANYLDFRMRAAGYRGPSVFSPAAVKMIARNSLGLTRRINILADKSLLAAFSKTTHEVGQREVQAAIHDCEFSDATYGGKKSPKWLLPVSASLVGAAVASIIAWQMLYQPPVPAVPVKPPPAEAPSSPPAQATSTAATASTSEPAAPLIDAAANAPNAAAPAASMPAAQTETQPAATSAAPSSVPDPANSEGTGKLTAEYLTAGRTWLAQMPDDRWFLQIASKEAHDQQAIENLLASAAAGKVDTGKLRVYFSELSGKPKYGIIYGEYSSYAAANAAITSLPPVLKANQPYPRQVIRLR